MIQAQRIYAMLGNESLWHAAERTTQALGEAGVAHAVCGGVAVCLHGYQRNTVDVDLIARSDDVPKVRPCLEAVGVSVKFLIAGEPAGDDSEVCFPDPEDVANIERIEGLPVLRLSKLIEVKLACGLGNPRRTHKDFADVVELIVIRNLNSSFARYLHKSLRKTYRELVKKARGE